MAQLEHIEAIEKRLWNEGYLGKQRIRIKRDVHKSINFFQVSAHKTSKRKLKLAASLGRHWRLHLLRVKLYD